MKQSDKELKVIVDVGASIGEFASHVLTHDKNIEVFAVEPNEEFCKFYLENIRAKFPSRMKIFYHALSNISGNFEFYGSKVLEGNIGSLKKLNPNKQWDEYLEKNIDKSSLQINSIVKVKSVSEFISKNQISRIDFLKIDAQGSDVEILELFLSCTPISCAVVEVNTLSNSSENIYLSNNNLNELIKIISYYKLKIIKIVPNGDLTELNIFLAENEVEGLRIIEDLNLKNSTVFSRGWEVVVGKKLPNSNKDLGARLLHKIFLGLKNPVKSGKSVMRKLSN